MGTNCDENAAAPVAAKNNSKMTETTVNPGGQEQLFTLSLQTYYPPGSNNYNGFVDMIWKDARNKFASSVRSTFCDPSEGNDLATN